MPRKECIIILATDEQLVPDRTYENLEITARKIGPSDGIVKYEVAAENIFVLVVNQADASG